MKKILVLMLVALIGISAITIFFFEKVEVRSDSVVYLPIREKCAEVLNADVDDIEILLFKSKEYKEYIIIKNKGKLYKFTEELTGECDYELFSSLCSTAYFDINEFFVESLQLEVKGFQIVYKYDPKVHFELEKRALKSVNTKALIDFKELLEEEYENIYGSAWWTKACETLLKIETDVVWFIVLDSEDVDYFLVESENIEKFNKLVLGLSDSNYILPNMTVRMTDGPGYLVDF